MSGVEGTGFVASLQAQMREARQEAVCAPKLRRLIAEAERTARFLDDIPGPSARYRARELRAEIAAAKDPGMIR